MVRACAAWMIPSKLPLEVGDKRIDPGVIRLLNRQGVWHFYGYLWCFEVLNFWPRDAMQEITRTGV
jgi:hypothetical protein